MKILLALERETEAQLLSAGLETLGHRTLFGSGLEACVKLLRQCRPDLLVADERLRRDEPESGLRLAEACRIPLEQSHSCCRTRALILIRVAEWDRMKRAQRTGAHVIVKGTNFEPVVRYIQTIADDMVTDKILGPILFGVHRFRGRCPHTSCKTCGWEGATVSCGTSEADVVLTPVRIAILNALFRLRRGQSATEITAVVNESHFLRSILRYRILKETSVKMEISRIRDAITDALQQIGVPYSGSHFLPALPYGVERYRLWGNWNLLHHPASRWRPGNIHATSALSGGGR